MKIATCIHRHCAKIQKVIFCTQASLHVTSGAGELGNDVADVSYSRWVRKRMYFDISITHNTLHHGGQSRGRRGEETSFILTPAQLHSINIIETDTRFWRLLLMTGKKIIQRKRALQGYFMFLCNSRNNCFVNYFHYSNIIAIQQ